MERQASSADPASVGPRSIRLRSLALEDEPSALSAHEEMEAEGFPFLLGYSADVSWSEYLRRLDLVRRGIDLAPSWVPMTFLLAERGGSIVGRTSVRHELNEFLLREGGHIGFGVLRAYREQGIATEILRKSLIVAGSLGIGPVLLTCDDDNHASAAVIERCGGVLESYVEPEAGGTLIRRYWIQ